MKYIDTPDTFYSNTDLQIALVSSFPRFLVRTSANDAICAAQVMNAGTGNLLDLACRDRRLVVLLVVLVATIRARL
eukprot:SAG31_NODE_2405_length_5763_cov_4.872881_3_plen_76_part_00